jgi:hypothetical protein
MAGRISLLCAAVLMTLADAGRIAQATPVDLVVGADAPTGGARLVKHFMLAPGTMVSGITFLSNDPRTIFPGVSLLQGPTTTLARATVLAGFTDVRPLVGHRVQVIISPPIRARSDLYVAVTLPPSRGIRAVGDGAGIGALQLRIRK